MIKFSRPTAKSGSPSGSADNRPDMQITEIMGIRGMMRGHDLTDDGLLTPEIEYTQWFEVQNLENTDTTQLV